MLILMSQVFGLGFICRCRTLWGSSSNWSVIIGPWLIRHLVGRVYTCILYRLCSVYTFVFYRWLKPSVMSGWIRVMRFWYRFHVHDVQFVHRGFVMYIVYWMYNLYKCTLKRTLGFGSVSTYNARATIVHFVHFVHSDFHKNFSHACVGAWYKENDVQSVHLLFLSYARSLTIPKNRCAKLPPPPLQIPGNMLYNRSHNTTAQRTKNHGRQRPFPDPYPHPSQRSPRISPRRGESVLGPRGRCRAHGCAHSELLYARIRILGHDRRGNRGGACSHSRLIRAPPQPKSLDHKSKDFTSRKRTK